MPSIYFKLNNHAQKTQNFVAYYANPDATAYSPYTSEVGERLIVTSKGKKSMPNGFARLRVGDCLVVFQTIVWGNANQYLARVVTHILEVIDRPVPNQFPSPQWPNPEGFIHGVATKVQARLKPNNFGGYYDEDTGELDMLASRCPNTSILTSDLGLQATPANGYVYESFDGRSIGKSDLLRGVTDTNGYVLSDDWDDFTATL